jgi:L-glyceraldehyde 3-phosphate reductase
MTSVLIGASSVAQLDENLDALGNTGFSEAELAAIDQYAVEGGIDLWRGPATS